jgi:hypothetical protein
MAIKDEDSFIKKIEAEFKNDEDNEIKGENKIGPLPREKTLKGINRKDISYSSKKGKSAETSGKTQSKRGKTYKNQRSEPEQKKPIVRKFILYPTLAIVLLILFVVFVSSKNPSSNQKSSEVNVDYYSSKPIPEQQPAKTVETVPSESKPEPILNEQNTTTEKTAECEIMMGNQIVFNDKCVFISTQDGSFSLSNLKKDDPLFDNILVVTVNIERKSVADIHGLTKDGVNSRWGEAERSNEDKSCWVGSDFKVLC